MREETLVPGVELLESMRSVGYSFNAAVADIVDNSIAAGAKKVDIFADSVGGEYVAFVDDGTGMSPTGARDALKLAGSRHVERTGSDLGRFGLGLKTASLSQGRRLTVVTKRDGVVTGLQWDLDHVLSTGTWAIRVLDDLEIAAVPHATVVLASEHGTLVAWHSLDYLLSGARDVPSWMAALLLSLREHLGLVFQRFLEGREALQLSVNGIAVKSIDPFLERNPRTQSAPVENVAIHGHIVTVEAFTLPHVSGLSAKERNREDLGARMREYQGFYVYRNRRLISAGGWFGLAKQDELSKQTRVRVDIPPALDHHWQLDIKKSRVEPPQAFRQRFRQIIDQVKVPSARVHRFRGRQAAEPELTYFWRVVEDRGGFRYEINSDHPAVQLVRSAVAVDYEEAFDQLLTDLANTFPVSDAYVRMADNSQRVRLVHTDLDVVKRLRAVRDSGAGGVEADQMSAVLAKMEPFNEVPNLSELVAELWKENK